MRRQSPSCGFYATSRSWNTCRRPMQWPDSSCMHRRSRLSAICAWQSAKHGKRGTNRCCGGCCLGAANVVRRKQRSFSMRLPPGCEPDFQLAEVGPMVAWPEPLPQTVERRTGPARRLLSLCLSQRRRPVATKKDGAQACGPCPVRFKSRWFSTADFCRPCRTGA